ncbi:DDE-type integrase/transposase/recombinase [Kitasatospora sp. NPDC092948]|uniref:DDE-type integrase/transposase/recombinase n=1 Tax=Kitasatospora sp. NPDC092948 TaxID=3364088 RepID=UPI003804CEE8
MAPAPNRARVADSAHVPAWVGTVYVTFVVDAFSRRIVGWSAATTERAELVLAVLEMAPWQRDRVGTRPRPGELTHRTIRTPGRHTRPSRSPSTWTGLASPHPSDRSATCWTTRPEAPANARRSRTRHHRVGGLGTTTADSAVRSASKSRRNQVGQRPKPFSSPRPAFERAAPTKVVT